MTTSLSLFSCQEAAAEIVKDVFHTMLHYPVEQSCDAYVPGAHMVTAVVFFAGQCKGATLLECSRDQAVALAGQLMGDEAHCEIDDDVRDSLGELANMIAGNLKSLLPAGLALSVPSVMNGSDYAYKICGSSIVERLSFRGNAGPFWVTLVEMVEKVK